MGIFQICMRGTKKFSDKIFLASYCVLLFSSTGFPLVLFFFGVPNTALVFFLKY